MLRQGNEIPEANDGPTKIAQSSENFSPCAGDQLVITLWSNGYELRAAT